MYSLTYKKIKLPYLDIQSTTGTRLLYILKDEKEQGKCWKKDNKYHRNKSPALEYDNGYKEWWLNGTRHRNPHEGPAVLLSESFYFVFGKQFHVSIHENGTKEIYCYSETYKKLVLHSLDQYYIPAIVYANGDEEYWYNGFRHRDDGPAATIGNKQYWFNCGNFVKTESLCIL